MQKIEFTQAHRLTPASVLLVMKNICPNFPNQNVLFCLINTAKLKHIEDYKSENSNIWEAGAREFKVAESILKKHCFVVLKGLESQLIESTAVAADTQISPSLHRCLGSPSLCLHLWMVRKNMRPRSQL